MSGWRNVTAKKKKRVRLSRANRKAQQHKSRYGVKTKARELKTDDGVSIAYDIINQKGTISTISSVAGYWADGKRRRKQEPLFVHPTRSPVRKRI